MKPFNNNNGEYPIGDPPEEKQSLSCPGNESVPSKESKKLVDDYAEQVRKEALIAILTDPYYA